jgi:hypothetical protein
MFNFLKKFFKKEKKNVITQKDLKDMTAYLQSDPFNKTPPRQEGIIRIDNVIYPKKQK